MITKYETRKLGDIFTFKNGINFDKKQKKETGVLTIDVFNMYGNNLQVELKNLYRIDKNITEEYKLLKGDILFVRSSVKEEGVAWASYFKDINEPVTFCGFIIRARPKIKINPKYFIYLLRSEELRKKLVSKAKKSTITNINQSNLSEIEVPLPPFKEQENIVEKLDILFAEIDKAKANAEQNLKNAKDLFESYLRNVFENKGITWEKKLLSDICEVKDGTHDSPRYIKEGIPFVTQKNISKNGLSFINTKFITEEDHNKFYKRSNVSVGDILISMIGANRGMAAIVDDKRVFSIKNVGLIKEDKNINKNFLLYFLKSPLASKYVKDMSKGGAQEFIGLTSLRGFPVPYPRLKEQEIIVQRLDALSNETERLEEIYQKKIQNLEELKKSILQKAFNGELI